MDSPQTQLKRSLESEDDDVSSGAPWLVPSSLDGGSLHRYRDRTGKETLKFQSKNHRYTSNYFGIDEFSGDFNNNELCPGSELRYRRYFSSNAGHKVTSTLDRPESLSKKYHGESDYSHQLSRTFRDSEVIVLTAGSRRQIQIKVPSILSFFDLNSTLLLQFIPAIPPNDRNRPSAPMIHTKNPNEDPFDDSVSLATKSNRNEAEGILTRRMMKIQLTWKVQAISFASVISPPLSVDRN